MAADEILEYLDWDSSFFGKRIARLKTGHLDRDIAERVENLGDQCEIDCLYVLADPADISCIQVAAQYGYDLVDIKLTLEKSSEGSPDSGEPTNAPAIQAWAAADLPELRKIARENHRNTRFYRDRYFTREQCDRLYETWIENSCGGYAEAVFVARCRGEVAGYITCHLTGSAGSIGLIAITPQCRSAGLGSQLVRFALGWFCTQGAATVSVTTQADNVAAMRIYERVGFLTRSVRLVYHKWFLRSER